MRQLVYVAHPVAGDVVGNISRAKLWLRWLKRAEPGVAFIAPWLAAIEAGEDDSDPVQRESGLLDCEATVARCDGIVLCGPRISTGMQREMDAHDAGGAGFAGWCVDFTPYLLSVPDDALLASEAFCDLQKRARR